MSQIQALEDRASTEIDRARQETNATNAKVKMEAVSHAEREAELHAALLDAQQGLSELKGRLDALSDQRPTNGSTTAPK